jgi:hypothetical protein
MAEEKREGGRARDTEMSGTPQELEKLNRSVMRQLPAQTIRIILLAHVKADSGVKIAKVMRLRVLRPVCFMRVCCWKFASNRKY